MRQLNFLKIFFYTLIVISLIYIVNNIGLSKLTDNIKEMGIYIPLGIIILRSTSIVIPALPGTAYSILAGALLGFKYGYLTICFSDLIACNLCFYLSRRYGKDILYRITSKNLSSKIQNLSQKHLEGNTILMTGLLMTGLFDFMCYAIGLTKVSYNKFILALIISIILSNMPIVALGAGLITNGRIILGLSLVGIFILSYINTKIGKSRVINE